MCGAELQKSPLLILLASVNLFDFTICSCPVVQTDPKLWLVLIGTFLLSLFLVQIWYCCRSVKQPFVGLFLCCLWLDCCGFYFPLASIELSCFGFYSQVLIYILVVSLASLDFDEPVALPISLACVE